MVEFLQSFAPGLEGQAFWLPLVWAVLLAIAVAMYVVVDGFDLGVGILFTSAQSENWRDRMMLSVAPIWDGNETWLILGGGGLLAVFGMAYWVILPALYIPLLIMLIALIFRGVAFEFRFKADTSKRIWDYAFHYGSLVATFAQGVVLGAFVQGFEVQNRPVRRRHLRLVLALQPHDRRRPRLRLRIARRHLVRDENHGRARDVVAAHVGALPHRHHRVHGHRQRLGAVSGHRDRAALVLDAEHRLPRGGAAGHRLRGLADLSHPAGRPALPAVPVEHRALPARVLRASRSRSFPISSRPTSRSGRPRTGRNRRCSRSSATRS
jgi:hypothetical protein